MGQSDATALELQDNRGITAKWINVLYRGKDLTAPGSWILVPPGDAALTRRVKAAGDHWVVAEKKGRKTFSRGVWAPAATIVRIRADLEAERSTEGFAKKKEADARRRDKTQVAYVDDFLGAVRSFLGFHENYADLADQMARAVTDHATPVGRSAFLSNSEPKLP